MGITHITVAVAPMGGQKKPWKALFLVDSGAKDTLVPRRVLRRLGIKPYRRDWYKLADGSLVDFDIGAAMITVKGVTVASEALFGPRRRRAVLGRHHHAIGQPHLRRPLRTTCAVAARQAAESTGPTGSEILTSLWIVQESGARIRGSS
jgi:predicted aspartyl protease